MGASGLETGASYRGRSHFLVPVDFLPKPLAKRSLDEVIAECKLEQGTWEEMRNEIFEEAELDDEDE